MKDEATIAVIKALDAANVQYMLGGAYSSNAYGVYREPDDADFEIDLNGATINELRQRLEPTVRVDYELHVEIVSRRHRYTAKVVGVPFVIEFFLLNDDPHSQERFRKRRLIDMLGHQVWVPTVEDVIVNKLRWSVLGDRLKHMSDVHGVIAIQGDRIDWSYVRRWCVQHGSTDLLDEVRNGA
jgi:hypothetical protein